MNDQEDYSHITTKNCTACNNPIPLERLAYIPNTNYCVNCTDTHTPTKTHDPNELCAKASQSCQNGFAPKD